jgi:hypothetical protein
LVKQESSVNVLFSGLFSHEDIAGLAFGVSAGQPILMRQKLRPKYLTSAKSAEVANGLRYFGNHANNIQAIGRGEFANQSLPS